MTRDEKIAEAQRLRARGLTYREIGAQLGVTKGCLAKWLHPDRARAWNQHDNDRRSVAKRAWENAHDRGQCPCGAVMGVGARRHGYKVCRDCCAEMAHVERAWRMQPVYEMWHAGLSLREIAAQLGMAPGTVSFHVSTMRSEGWDMPHRYNVTPDGRRLAGRAA
jgi:DNA-binding CsgD family transcriptional regulator